MPNYYIKHRPPGSPLWHVDGPYPSRQVALFRRSELRRRLGNVGDAAARVIEEVRQ